ncbi:hypothetical protein NY547_02520 [Cnuibacter physcomitrellae]|uniref:hypothetical protein n=1 Tax=Cnuibacter physcomitrellae TaxID=1619308 RepID=UPI0021760CA7|nr:hypothetical protein [Cnuibacter physcomitrellae]MCS5496113.1 hypothetical protein [Cnuibacter physcomitrellae]
MFQLLVSTAVGLQRAMFLMPAFSAQRTTGRSRIPLTWVLIIGLPTTTILALSMPFALGLVGPDFVSAAALGFLVGLVALTQDALRYILFSRALVAGALASDALWLLGVVAGLVTLNQSLAWESAAAVWGISGAAAALIAAAFLLRSHSDLPAASLRATFRLGRWSGLDAALSGFANLLPMLVTSLALGTDLAGVYRVLQSALGPLNILSASIATSFGMDSWKLTSRSELQRLRTRTVRLGLILTLSSIAYLAVAEPLVIAITGIGHDQLIRVALIVAFAGLLGAATIPFNSAALSLGYQHLGVVLRLVIVSAALAVSILSAASVWVPWDDPIGTTTVVSASVGFAGWLLAFFYAMRREGNRLS